MELTNPDNDHPTGHMDVGEGFKDIAPDLQKYVVEFAFGDIYSRPGIDNKQKVLTTISALVAQGTPQIEMHIRTGLVVGLTPEEIHPVYRISTGAECFKSCSKSVCRRRSHSDNVSR